MKYELELRQVLCLVCLVVWSGAAVASSSGINGFSGNPNTTGGLICTACHSGGIEPTVTLSGPTNVAPGSVNVYTLTISGGQEIAGGLDVTTAEGATTPVGTLVPTSADTQILFNELTHTTPRAADLAGNVSWGFRWQAPAAPATVTMYGAGNSVNLQGGTNGDNAAADTLVIQVGAAPQTPGESLALDNLAYDPTTGDISLTYLSGCETTDSSLFYGPLGQVATYGWTGESCAIGIGDGTPATQHTFDPGAGSYFFVVVGNDGSDEGSYGLALDGGGASSERPPFAGNACGTVQMLTDRCD